MEPVTLQARVEQAIAAGFSVAVLARHAKTTTSAVSQWRSGNVKTLKAATAAALEAGTGWSASWWATGKGQREVAARRPAPVPPPPGFADRHEVSDSDWDALQALKVLSSPEEIEELKRRAAALKERAESAWGSAQKGSRR